MDKTPITFLSLMASIIVLICVIGCSDNFKTKRIIGQDGSEYDVAIIDGCEYIRSFTIVSGKAHEA